MTTNMSRWNGSTWIEVTHDHDAAYIGVAIGGQTITNPTAGNDVFKVKGAASQSGALFKAQTSVPDDVFVIDADGAATHKLTSTTAFNIVKLDGTSYVVVNTSTGPNFQLRNGMNLVAYSDNGTTAKWTLTGSTGATSQAGALTVSAGGANITGTLAMTGGITVSSGNSLAVTITSGTAYVGAWAGGANYARFGNGSSATNDYGLIQLNTGDVYLSGTVITARITNGTNRLLIDSTGFTGYASSTGYVQATTTAATLYCGSYFQAVNGGTAVVQSNYTGTPYLQAGSTNFCYHAYSSASPSWGGAPLVAFGSGRSALVLHNGTTAPLIQSDNGGGDRIYCKASDGATFTDIMASAFPTSSAIRFKTNIERVSDIELMSRLALTPQLVTFEKPEEARAHDVVLDERFTALNERWQAAGKKALRPEAKHFRRERHDCSIHSCGGTAENPCGVIINEEPDVGFIAEEMVHIWPETVYVDPTGEVEAIDYSKLAAVSLRAVAVLQKRLIELERQVADLTTHQG